MDKKNFIKVSDESTKRQLLDLGYKLISEDGSVATFLNDLSRPQTYSCKKVVYTNKLNV